MPGLGELEDSSVYVCMFVFWELNPGLCTCKSNTLILMHTSSPEKERIHSAEYSSSEWEEIDYMEAGRHTQRGPRYLLKRKVRCSNGGN